MRPLAKKVEKKSLPSNWIFHFLDFKPLSGGKIRHRVSLLKYQSLIMIFGGKDQRFLSCLLRRTGGNFASFALLDGFIGSKYGLKDTKKTLNSKERLTYA